MTMKDFELRIVLTEIEMLRMKRQRERDVSSPSTWKRFTQQELNDEVCPTYKNLLLGRSSRIPDRQTIIRIASYLECNADERNDLLLSAGYLPIPNVLAGRALEQALERAARTMHEVSYPAMIVTHTQEIKGYNALFRRLFDIAPDRFGDSPLNRVDLHFSTDLPLRARSTFDPESYEQWRTHAVSGIRSFKREYMLFHTDAWYQRVVQNMQSYKDLELDDTLPESQEQAEPIQTILAKTGSTDEFIPVRFKQMAMSTGDQMDPQIVLFLPADASARDAFRDFGCDPN